MSRTADNIGMLYDWVHYFLVARSVESLRSRDNELAGLLKDILDIAKITDCSVIEELNKKTRKSNEFIESSKIGGGSRALGKKSGIAKICRVTSVRTKYGRLLNALVQNFQPPMVLELGTSLGFSAFYLAKNNSTEVITIDGNTEVYKQAQQLNSELGFNNIRFVNALFDDALPELSDKIPPNALVFIDGNHTYDSTMRYYKFLRQRLPDGILIFDDIYWSRGMKKAWCEIAGLEELVIDLFQFGIVLSHNHSTGYYRLRY